MCVSSPLGVVEYSQDIMPKKMRLQSVGQWMCSNVCFFACICVGLDFLVYLFDVLLLGPEFCSPRVVSVIIRVFYLSTLGSGCSEGASGRMQIHPILRICQFCGGVFFS